MVKRVTEGVPEDMFIVVVFAALVLALVLLFIYFLGLFLA